MLNIVSSHQNENEFRDENENKLCKNAKKEQRRQNSHSRLKTKFDLNAATTS